MVKKSAKKCEKKATKVQDNSWIPDFLTRNEATWIMENEPYKLAMDQTKRKWDKTPHTEFIRHYKGTFITDEEKRGFILVCPYVDTEDTDADIELYFAVVDKDCRGQGVMSALMAKLVSQYKGKRVWLQCAEHNKKVWEHFGFVETNTINKVEDNVDDECPYEYKLQL